MALLLSWPKWLSSWKTISQPPSHSLTPLATILIGSSAPSSFSSSARISGFFYCGDGISDLSAARETDLLFAKAGHDLIAYCKKENVPYTVFNDFSDIMRDVKSVVEGGKTAADVAMNR